MGIAALLAGLLALSSPTRVQSTAAYWSMPKLLHRIDHAAIHVGTRSVRVHEDTTLCAGTGRSIRKDGVRLWRRFVCTYTTFTGAGVDRDLDFTVRTLGRRRYVISAVHWVTATR